MSKKELEERVAQLEKELSTLKGKLKNKDEFEPKKGEEFYTIYSTGYISRECSYADDKRILFGNWFKTKEEAEKQSEYNRVMNRYRKYVEYYSEPLDWNNFNQTKYYLEYDYTSTRLDTPNSCVFKNAFQIYASSKEIIKQAIIYSAGSEEEFKKIVFGVK